MLRTVSPRLDRQWYADWCRDRCQLPACGKLCTTVPVPMNVLHEANVAKKSEAHRQKLTKGVEAKPKMLKKSQQC